MKIIRKITGWTNLRSFSILKIFPKIFFKINLGIHKKADFTPVYSKNEKISIKNSEVDKTTLF